MISVEAAMIVWDLIENNGISDEQARMILAEFDKSSTGKPAVPESAPTVVPCRPGNSEPYRGTDWFRYKPSTTPVEEEQQRFRDPLPGEFPNIMCHCGNS